MTCYAALMNDIIGSTWTISELDINSMKLVDKVAKIVSIIDGPECDPQDYVIYEVDGEEKDCSMSIFIKKVEQASV